MILPSFLKSFFSQTNPYEEIINSISEIREEHKTNNKLGFVSEQIKIRKEDNHYDLCYCLTTEEGQTMTIVYPLGISNKNFLSTKICKELEFSREVIIEQNHW